MQRHICNKTFSTNKENHPHKNPLEKKKDKNYQSLFNRGYLKNTRSNIQISSFDDE